MGSPAGHIGRGPGVNCAFWSTWQAHQACFRRAWIRRSPWFQRERRYFVRTVRADYTIVNSGVHPKKTRKRGRRCGSSKQRNEAILDTSPHLVVSPIINNIFFGQCYLSDTSGGGKECYNYYLGLLREVCPRNIPCVPTRIPRVPTKTLIGGLS